MSGASKLPFDLEAFARKERAALSKGKRLAQMYQRQALIKGDNKFRMHNKLNTSLQSINQLKTKVVPEAVVLP